MLKTVLFASLIMVGGAVLASDAVRFFARAPAPPRESAAKKLEEPRPGSVSLRADPDGHFRVDTIVAGKRVPMLVDTGATVIALSYEDGQTLNLVSGSDRFTDGRVSTANGAVGVKRVVLRDVRIGSVRIDDVTAVVLPKGAMDGSLLGMSFLGRLRKLETGRGKLVMER